MSTDSIFPSITLKKNLNRSDIIDTIEQIVKNFCAINRIKKHTRALSEKECNDILFAAVLFESIPKLARDITLDYIEIETNIITMWREQCKISFSVCYKNLKCKGALHYATGYILNTPSGEQYIPHIKMHFKHYSNKDNFVKSISDFMSSITNSFTIDNYIKISNLESSKYFRVHEIIQKILDDSLDGEFERIVFIVTKIIRLETDVTLDEIYIIVSQTLEDETEISLHFLNIITNIMAKFDSNEYLKYWESLFIAINDDNFVQLLYTCCKIYPFYKSILSFLEIYLRKIVINENDDENTLSIPQDIDANFSLLSKISIDDIAKLLLVLMSENFSYYKDVKCRVKTFCTSYDVYRYLKVKLFNIRKNK